MSSDYQNESLKSLEKAKDNWQEKLADFEREFSISNDPSKKFELIKRIQECRQEIIRIETQINRFQKTASSKLSESIRSRVLENVKREVESLLDYRLYQETLINLEKESQPKHVIRATDKSAKKPDELLSPQTTIIDFFDKKEVSGKLLILGEAGSGKTVTLLELAQKLIIRAENDLSKPIPIWLSLSSWKKQKIEKWIVAEYLSVYGGVSERDIWNLLEGRQLLPLLDNLDELKKNQFKCAEDINKFLNSQYRPKYIVICSRITEYERCYPKLQLNGAICLQSLSKKQIKEYFLQIERANIWKHIKFNNKLLAIIEKPLFLDILTRIYENISLEKLQENNHQLDQHSYLLNTYIDYAFEDTFRCIHKKQWLSWLAKRLEENQEVDFLLEKMQFDWLLNQKHKRLYKVLVALIVTLISLPILSIIVSESLRFGFMQIPRYQSIKIHDFPIAVILSICLGYFLGFFVTTISPVENIKFPGEDILQELKSIPFIERILGIIDRTLGEFLTNQMRVTPHEASIPALIMKIFSILLIGWLFPITALIRGLIRGLKDPEIDEKRRDYPNQGIHKSALNSVIYAVITAVIILLPVLMYMLIILGIDKLFHKNINFIYEESLAILLIFGLIGLLTGVLYPGLAVIQHITLRLILAWNNYIPLNYVRFLEEATEKTILERIGGRYRFMHRLLQEHFANYRWLEKNIHSKGLSRN